MKPAVEAAIQELEAAQIGTAIRHLADADGGAFVVVDGVEIGPAFEPSTTWIEFQVTWGYPDADCYPHFIDADVRYVGAADEPVQSADGNLPTAMGRGFESPGFKRSAIQVSRRSNRRNADTDSALQKLLRVVEFLRTR